MERSSWSTLGSGMNSTVYALAVSGSDLYAGGDFTLAGGGLVSRIAKWDGSSWSALRSISGGSVRALAVSGSDLYVGGSFTATGADGHIAYSIAKWDGINWNALGSGMNNSVFALAVSGGDEFFPGESPLRKVARVAVCLWLAIPDHRRSAPQREPDWI